MLRFCGVLLLLCLVLLLDYKLSEAKEELALGPNTLRSRYSFLATQCPQDFLFLMTCFFLTWLYEEAQFPTWYTLS